MCYVVTVIGGWRWRLFEPWWNAFVFPTAQQRFCWVSISGVGSGTPLGKHCWNLAGTLLALGWNPWETGETLLESCWKVAEVSNLAGALRELCWNLAGTWWTLAGTWCDLAGNLAGTLLLEPCCWNLWLEHLPWNQCGRRFCFSFCIVSCFAYCAGLWCWKSGWIFCWNRVATLLEPMWG